jgi:SAM-dependent methyltransferase
MPLLNAVARRGFQVLFRSRRALRREVAAFAAPLRGARVLELGSGKPVKGRYSYSCADLVPASNEVVMSDLDPSFGHLVVDVTGMDFDQEFDAIICSNVLEHVYDGANAVERLRRALKPGGQLFVSVPFMFPLHDEPHDYWRYTEHALRRLLGGFSEVRIRHRGLRRAPLAYYVAARR